MKVLLIAAGTDVKDSVTLRVFNKDISMSGAEMHELLKEADLERHGYLKEVSTTVTSKPGSSTPNVLKTVLYYKVVPCSRVMEVEQELDRLLNGVLGSSVAQKA